MNQVQSILHSPDSAAYEKIRAFVIGQVVKSGSNPMRLDSYRAIASQFGVTQTTVMKALKDLVDDGFLTVKKGIGTFTCPERLSGREDSKIIGLLFGDGKKVFTGRQDWRRAFEYLDALFQKSDSYQIQNIFLTSVKSEATREILSLGLNGVIWISPESSIFDSMRELRDAGFPQLSVGRVIEGVTSTTPDIQQEYCSATEAMLKEGRRRILLVIPSSDQPDVFMPAIAGWRKAFEKRLLPYESSWVLTGVNDLKRNFSERIAKLNPDGICFCASISDYYDSLIRSVDIAEKCRLYCSYYNVTDSLGGYVGYIGYPDIASVAKMGVECFHAQVSGAKAAAKTLLVPTQIKLVNARKG